MSGMSNPSKTGWTYNLYSPYIYWGAAEVAMPSASTSKASARPLHGRSWDEPTLARGEPVPRGDAPQGRTFRS
jgi:hypothetical protein